MTDQSFPVLYTFRRCPYAIRARLALRYAGIKVVLREVDLRRKPVSMVNISPKGTVPVLVLDGKSCGLHVIDESVDIMFWALGQNDPDGWLRVGREIANIWIQKNDVQFKPWLDRYKYPERGAPFAEGNARRHCEKFMDELEQCLRLQPYICSSQASIVDYALYPFVRQFAFVDRDWFLSSEYVAVSRWLQAWLESPLFSAVMGKYVPWQPGDTVTLF